MAIYETIVIAKPKLPNIKSIMKTYKSIIQKYSKNKIVKLDDLKEKQLAYVLKDKYKTGYYFILTWKGENNNVNELEIRLKTDDDVLKFITLKTDHGEDYLEDCSEDCSEDDKPIYCEPQPDALDVLLGLATYNKPNINISEKSNPNAITGANANVYQEELDIISNVLEQVKFKEKYLELDNDLKNNLNTAIDILKNWQDHGN